MMAIRPEVQTEGSRPMASRAAALCAVWLFGFMSACGQSSETSIASTNQSKAQPPSSSDELQAASIPDSDRSDFCRAAVAAVMGREFQRVDFIGPSGEYPVVGYVRANDGKSFRYACKFDGSRVIWASFDANGPGSDLGRWRESAEDEVVSIIVDGSALVVTQSFSDGSSTVKRFERG
jgi:hypothetical protein